MIENNFWNTILPACIATFGSLVVYYYSRDLVKTDRRFALMTRFLLSANVIIWFGIGLMWIN